MGGRITAQQRGGLLLRARRPQAIQQLAHGVRVVEGDAGGRITIQQRGGLLLRACRPQAIQQPAGIGSAAAAAVLFGVVTGVVEQLSTPLDLSSAASPPAVLAGDRRTGTALGAVIGAWAGFVAGVVPGLAARVAVGVVVGGIASFLFSAWPFYAIARIWLAVRRELPWQFMGFLADAHSRGVLRQAGAAYQFRHIELQHRLAARAVNNVPGPRDGAGEAATLPSAEQEAP